MKASRTASPEGAAFSARGDRSFPLESVSIQSFRLRHALDVGEVTLHTGPFADELARSFGALAVTFAADIYFRKGAWNPASEEGRKLLAHELTHAAQYTEKRITPVVEREELEAEARRVEKAAVGEEELFVSLEVGGELLRIPGSCVPAEARRIAANFRTWLVEQKDLLDEEEYLGLLCSLENWLRQL
jgi:hypothetical protein